MNLIPALEKAYTEEHLSAREAQARAEWIAWAPIVFQASRLMVKLGILDLLRDSSYTFTVAAGSASGRFLVKLSPTADGVIRAPRFARWDGDRLVVSGEGTLEAYDVMGRKISEFGIRNSETSINKSTFPGTGVYILRLGGESQKIVIR